VEISSAALLKKQSFSASYLLQFMKMMDMFAKVLNRETTETERDDRETTEREREATEKQQRERREITQRRRILMR